MCLGPPGSSDRIHQLSHSPAQSSQTHSPYDLTAAYRRILALTAALALSLAVPTAQAQRIRVQMGAGEAPNRGRTFAAALHPSEEAGTLMSRAKQGIEREDWKLVVDSLQRIIELPGEHVLTSDGRVYESARRQAHRQIAALPPAGLAAYRLMYDSEAAALLNKAVEQHDLALLRDIVDRYLVTRVGDDAGVTLADWLTDEGRFAEAVVILQLVKNIYPDSDLPRWTIPSRLAVCFAGMGRQQRAEAALKDVAASRPSATRAPSDTPPPQVAQRLERIREYIHRPVKNGDVAAATAWPLAYGRPSRDGIMPAVEPSFADHLLLMVPLGLPDEVDGVEQFANERKLLPTANMVAQDRTLVVKSGPILQALDVDTFEVLWRREPGSSKDDSAIIEEPEVPAGAWRQMGGWQLEANSRGPADGLDGNAIVRRLLRDSVGAGLTVYNNLVLTVEWIEEIPGVAQYADPRFGGMMFNAGFSPTNPNRIVAYSLQDGKPIWESNSRPGENKLGWVEFLSAPVPVDGVLLAPCRVNTDLYAVVIDPANGKITRTIYLCGTGGGPFDSLHALAPCVADGVVYIPTGRGVVFAVEASSWSIRWAVRYDDLAEKQTENQWLATPVIAVADSVLVAPPDADYLYALDRATGEIRWHAERGDSRFVLGATDRQVWLGGEQMQLLNVETGERVWTKTVATPTGRGVVSGERIYQPTAKGLLALNALTGENIDLAPAGEQRALGNLLVFNDTLYSTDVTLTREFPDMQRGYADAVERHSKDPTDPANAIRLARLELLRHSPAKALAALEKLPTPLQTASPRRREQANHLAVTSMLELAGSGAVNSDESRRLLEQARRIALSPQDAIESCLALGEYHRRENRPLDACLQYLSLALSPEGDQMMQDGEDFQQRARSAAVRRLADAAKGLSPEQSASLVEKLRSNLHDAAARHDTNAVLWLAESSLLGPVSGEAELLMGVWAVQDLRFEQAEGFLRRVLVHGASPELRAEAAARLAAIYVLPDELHLPVGAAQLLDTLDHDYAAVQIPANVLVDAIDAAQTQPAGAPERLAGADVARELRKRIDRRVLAKHEAALAPVRVGAVREPTSSSLREGRPLLVRDGRIEPLADQQLVMVDGNSPRVEAHGREDGRVRWPAELKLLNEMAIESRIESLENARLNGYSASAAARGLADGQTLVVNSVYGIHAIGLLTGRRLWSRRFDPPVVRRLERAGSDAWLWVQDGYVISVDRTGQLEVARTTAGDRLLWSRKRPGRHWYAVRARGPYVVAVNERLDEADVYRLEDGRYLGMCQFKQDPNRQVNILVFDDVICGPAAEDQVVALELATPGVERWRVRADASLSQLFKPSADLLAVSDRRGGVQLIEPASGNVHLPTVTVRACEDGITDGSLGDGVLYVCGYKKRRTAEEPQRWGLAAVRVRDRNVLWSRDDLGAWANLSQEVLECAANAIPVVAVSADDPIRPVVNGLAPRNAGTNKLSLVILDKATGSPLGQRIEMPLDNENSGSRALSVAVIPGQVQVTVGSTRWRFPFDSTLTPSDGHPATRPAGNGKPSTRPAPGGNAELIYP